MEKQMEHEMETGIIGLSWEYIGIMETIGIMMALLERTAIFVRRLLSFLVCLLVGSCTEILASFRNGEDCLAL